MGCQRSFTTIGLLPFTTEFVNDLLLNDYSPSPNGKRFDWLRTTGVSLGGGLALITGAQTDAYAFAFSGPNPTLARKTWNPPISLNNLKERVINIKPENDFVSSIGDVVPNYQLVRCRDWPAREHNCHSFWRIFCEYMYTCGSPSGKQMVACCVTLSSHLCNPGILVKLKCCTSTYKHLPLSSFICNHYMELRSSWGIL